MRLALVVQRYGREVAGGAELHARYLAAILSRRHRVTVLTTTARDYLTWEPFYPPGESVVDGVPVVRFPVERPRSLERFGRASARAYAAGHRPEDEQAWLEEQGPWAPELWRRLGRERDRYDALVAVSYRYATTVEAARVMGRRTLLVPTAEKDPAIELELSRQLFRSVGRVAFNSPEERALVEAAAGTPLAGEVVGIGSRLPADVDPERLGRRHGLDRPWLAYVGRIDRNKGCVEMFDFVAAFLAETALPHRLLLAGSAVLDVPSHPRFHHLGFVDEQDKFDAIAGADVLLMPSPYESLSLVTLEAMAMATPVLVNGACDVLRGQAQRANAGLWYHGYDEMFEALRLLLSTPRLRRILGRNGRAFYHRHYDDEVIASKLEALLEPLASG